MKTFQLQRLILPHDRRQWFSIYRTEFKAYQRQEMPSCLGVGGYGSDPAGFFRYSTWPAIRQLNWMLSFVRIGMTDGKTNRKIFKRQPSSLGISFFILSNLKNAGGGPCKRWDSCSPLQKAGKSISLVTSLKKSSPNCLRLVPQN